MGDVHPHALKARLARELSRLTFERWTFCQSPRPAKPSSAIPASRRWKPRSRPPCSPPANPASSPSAARITAWVTARSMPRTAIFFAARFESNSAASRNFVAFPPRPRNLKELALQIRQLLRCKEIGAVLVEPVQARGGINVPPPVFCRCCAGCAIESGALLILDEIYTGFGRTGKWFACEHTAHRARSHLPRQGPHRRLPAVRLRRPRGSHGRRLARVRRRSHPHQHLPRPSRRLRHGARANRGNPPAKTRSAQRALGKLSFARNCKRLAGIRNSKSPFAASA